MLVHSTSQAVDCDCPPPPSAPHLFSCGKFILLLSFSRFLNSTPLQLSCREGDLEITRLLVESKADVAARGGCGGFSPLKCALLRRNANVAAYLRSIGAPELSVHELCPALDYLRY